MAATTPKVPSVSEDQLNQLRQLASQDGGGVFYVATSKLNDNGTALVKRNDFFTMDQLEKRDEFCAAWGGGGKYLQYVYSRMPNERGKALEVISVEVDPNVYPPVPVDELRRRTLVAMEQQQRASAAVTAPAPPQVMAGTPVSYPWGMGGAYQMPWGVNPWQNPWATQAPGGDGRLEAAQREAQEWRERAKDERVAREAAERDSALKAEMREMKAMFADALKTIAAPAKSQVTDIATALAPVLTAMIQGQQSAQAAMTALLAQIATKDQTGPALAQAQAARDQMLDFMKTLEAQRAETTRLIVDLQKTDKTEGISKLLMASAQFQQSMIATMATALEKLAGDQEPIWKPALDKVLEMAEAGIGVIIAQDQNAKAAAEQTAASLSGATAPKALPEPKPQGEPKPKADQEPRPDPDDPMVKLAKAAAQAVKAGFTRWQDAKTDEAKEEAAYHTARSVVDYCQAVKTKNPNDADVNLFWGDHAQGTHRLLGGLLSQLGGDGTRFLQAIIAVMPDAVQDEADEASEDASADEPEPDQTPGPKQS